MKGLFLSLIFIFLCSSVAFTQQTVSIGTANTNPKAVLWLNSAGQNQGLIIPIVSNRSTVGATIQEKGMVVLDNSDGKIYYFDGSGWIGPIGGPAAATGNYTLQFTSNTVTLLKDGVAVATPANIQTVTVGGDLTGTVGAAQIAPGVITNADINATANIDITKINSGGATNNGRVLKVVGGVLTYATDDTGSAVPTLMNGQILVGNGTANSAAAVSGDLTMSNGVFTIGPGAVTDTKIGNGIAVSKLAASATNGQVLQTVAGTTQWATMPASPTLNTGQILVGNGATNSAATVSGDMTMNNGVFTIGPGAVTDTKIGNGITVTKLTASATNGQVLQTVAGTTQWANLPASVPDQTTQIGALVGNGSLITGRVASTGGHYFRRNSGNTDFEFGTIAATDIPNLDASKITTGTFAETRITGAGAGTRAILGSVNNNVGWVSGSPNQFLGTDAGGNLTFLSQSNFMNSALGSGQLFVGDAGGVAAPVTISGDITVDNTGNAQIAPNAIVDADVSATAGILGTKINPDFGTQNINTTGYIGINTPAPSYPVDISTITHAYGLNHTDGSIILSTYVGSGGPLGGAIGTQSNHPFFIYTNNGGARLTVMNGTGNVGIGTFNPTTKFEVNGFSKLGTDAPAIKIKKITGTTSSADGGSVNFATGVAADKIISITVLVDYSGFNHYLEQGYTNNPGYQFNWYGSDSIYVWNTFGNCFNILGKPLKILITYEE